MAQQKMVALQTTLDPLRKQLPRMQGRIIANMGGAAADQCTSRKKT